MTDYIALADKLADYANGDEFQRPVEEAERVIRALAQAAPEDERVAFEAWADKTWSAHVSRDYAWLGWRARAALFVAPAEPAQDREDAQRYRWLRDPKIAHWQMHDKHGCMVQGAKLDEAIDEAMRLRNDAARQAPKELADGGILDGTNRTTSGAIGQP